MQQPARGARPLDGPIGGRRSGEAQTGADGRKGSHPHSVAPPRPQAVAGKKCGASRTAMKSMSPRWRTCWKYTNGRMNLECDFAGNLKVKQKYLSAPGRSNMLYLPPGVSHSLLREPALPIVAH